MDTGSTYRYADRVLHEIAVQRMSPAGWRRYEAAVLGMQLAVDTGHVDELRVCAELLASLRIPHHKGAADPYRTDQPPHLHGATMRLASALAALAVEHREGS